MGAINDLPMSEILKIAILNGQIPRFLYKYTTADNALLALERGTAYFARFSQFNDEYEGFANLDVNNSLTEWAVFLENNGIFGVEASFLMATIQNNPSQAAQIIRDVIEENQKNNGFLCLSTKSNNVLMWAHYADQNKGCCLEYDLLADLDVFCRIKKIKYDDDTIAYNYLQNNGGAFEAMFHKSKQWEYEDEYRVISIGHPGPIKLKEGSLTGIIFGPKIDDEKKKELITKVKTAHCGVKLSEAVKGANPSVLDIQVINV